MLGCHNWFIFLFVVVCKGIIVSRIGRKKSWNILEAYQFEYGNQPEIEFSLKGLSTLCCVNLACILHVKNFMDLPIINFYLMEAAQITNIMFIRYDTFKDKNFAQYSNTRRKRMVPD